MKDNVKRIGDELLKHIRFVIHEAAQGDTTFEFKLRRWIYARLQLDERKTKNSIKQKLWDSGKTKCQHCKKKFSSLKGIELHRINSSLEYSVENCELIHKHCHQKI